MDRYLGNNDNLSIETNIEEKSVRVKIVVDNEGQEAINMGKLYEISLSTCSRNLSFY